MLKIRGAQHIDLIEVHRRSKQVALSLEAKIACPARSLSAFRDIGSRNKLRSFGCLLKAFDFIKI